MISQLGATDPLKDYAIRRGTCNTTLVHQKSLKDLDLTRPDICNSALWKFLL